VNYQMLHMNVLVKPEAIQTEMRLSSGLYMPSSAIPQDNRGVIVSVGGGLMTDHGVQIVPTSKVGDKVLYRSNQMGFEVEIDNEKYLVMSDRDILAVIN